MKPIITTLLACSVAFSAQAKRYADITGQVTDEHGAPLSGVVVSNGVDCTSTDAQGRYRLDGTRGVRHVFVSTPSGYLPPVEHGTIPVFYHAVDNDNIAPAYDFTLRKNPVDDTRHLCLVQADVQVTSEDDLRQYSVYLDDMIAYAKEHGEGVDVFSIDCGDIVGDCPHLFPYSIATSEKLQFPVYRVIGNHDMTYGGRTYEYSFKNFEDYFGPVCYSFNKGKLHYIVIDNNFYVNRDYQYIGYIDERTFEWMEQDLSYVPADMTIVVVAHIPTSSTKELAWNTLLQDETSNARGLYDLLSYRDAHLITGHTHFNQNVCFRPNLMEHNTAAVCGIWWKADVCSDGTPSGYGCYDVDGNDISWIYKSWGHPEDFQMRVYPIGTNPDKPADIIANVWNYDELWKVEWLENGVVMGEMTRYDGLDPLTQLVCSDRERVVYPWAMATTTDHLFCATPSDPTARIKVRATDRFGRQFTSSSSKAALDPAPTACGAKKPALMWIDAEANFARMSSTDSIDYYLQKIADLGFTHAVVDVRPITGEVLYDSELAPRMREWGGYTRPDFNYLGYFIEKGHDLGLEVYASMNVFCAGHNYHDRGLVYDGHPEWASVVYNPTRGLIPITEEKDKYGGMVNPCNPEYQDYIIKVMEELVSKYPALDGLMLDRVRFDGISADFSPESRKQFEAFLGKKVKRFPDDILSWRVQGGRPVPVNGKLAKPWYEWRSGVIKDFFAKARKAVKTANPNVDFATYTGAWYPSYYEVGVNFASPSYDPAQDYDWATPGYKDTAYAELIDTYVTGNYYTDITIDEYERRGGNPIWNETDSRAQKGIWYCVEGSCHNLRCILGDNPFIGGILVDQFYDMPDKLSQTIAENLNDSDGLMVFDIVHIITKGLWPQVEKGMRDGNQIK